MASGVLTVVTTGGTPRPPVSPAGRSTAAAQPRPARPTTRATNTRRNTSWPRSGHSPESRLSTNSARLSSAERTQKKQNAWIFSAITPISTRLNTAMPVLISNKPQPLREARRERDSPRSTSGSSASSSTAR